jgi:hypothetical protein
MVPYSCDERVPVTVGYQPLAQGAFSGAGLDHSSPSSSAIGFVIALTIKWASINLVDKRPSPTRNAVVKAEGQSHQSIS